jgi:hypothetical protein
MTRANVRHILPEQPGSFLLICCVLLLVSHLLSLLIRYFLARGYASIRPVRLTCYFKVMLADLFVPKPMATCSRRPHYEN